MEPQKCIISWRKLLLGGPPLAFNLVCRGVTLGPCLKTRKVAKCPCLASFVTASLYCTSDCRRVVPLEHGATSGPRRILGPPVSNMATDKFRANGSRPLKRKVAQPLTPQVLDFILLGRPFSCTYQKRKDLFGPIHSTCVVLVD